MCTHCGVLIFAFSVNCHKLSTVHVLCVNTLLEHLSALLGDSNTCGNGILFILSYKSLHMCALFQVSVAFFCYKAAKPCLPLIHRCHVCLLQPLAFSSCCSMTLWRVLVPFTVICCLCLYVSIISLRLAGKTDVPAISGELVHNQGFRRVAFSYYMKLFFGVFF